MDPFEAKSYAGGGAGRNTRSESVTVRLEPRTRYMCELAGRIQRRTLSSFIEEAIEKALQAVMWKDEDGTFHNLKDNRQLWDVFEPDRFAKLALNRPDLLNHHEQIVWKLVQESEVVWQNRWNGEGWAVTESSIIWKELRKHWDTFNKVARGELPMSALPEPPRPMDENDIPR